MTKEKSLNRRHILNCFLKFLFCFLHYSIATNGVPPSVSRRVMVNVHCEYWRRYFSYLKKRTKSLSNTSYNTGDF